MPNLTAPDLNFSPKGLYIGGEWQESIDGGTFQTINPSNREKLGDVPDATERDVERAVARDDRRALGALA